MKSKFYVFGITAAVIYVFAVILGGLLWPGYSHVSQAISELTFRQAPNQAIIQPLFWAYNLLLLAFAVGFFMWTEKKTLKASAIFLALCAFSGVMMFFFPQDPMNVALTTSGLLHFVFAGMAAITTLLAVLLAAIGTWKENRKISIFSIIIEAIIFISGPITASAPTTIPQYFGISERVTIGSFIVWVFVFSLYLGKLTKKES